MNPTWRRNTPHIMVHNQADLASTVVISFDNSISWYRRHILTRAKLAWKFSGELDCGVFVTIPVRKLEMELP